MIVKLKKLVFKRTSLTYYHCKTVLGTFCIDLLEKKWRICNQEDYDDVEKKFKDLNDAKEQIWNEYYSRIKAAFTKPPNSAINWKFFTKGKR